MWNIEARTGTAISMGGLKTLKMMNVLAVGGGSQIFHSTSTGDLEPEFRCATDNMPHAHADAGGRH